MVLAAHHTPQIEIATSRLSVFIRAAQVLAGQHGGTLYSRRGRKSSNEVLFDHFSVPLCLSPSLGLSSVSPSLRLSVSPSLRLSLSLSPLSLSLSSDH